MERTKHSSTGDSIKKMVYPNNRKIFNFDRSRGIEEVNLQDTDLQLEDE